MAECSSSKVGQEEHDEENAVSMVEVLEDEQLLQEDADAVLGASDDKNCTYLQGYLPRQALYACKTCIPEGGDPAGICLACCLECHEGHDLVELYTKRNFRCDCGNQKFGDTMKCKLCPDKSPQNEDNRYNHNYRGVYCKCERPYPDADDSVDDLMLQCVVCEDWFHGRHLGDSRLPVHDEFEEMICDECMNRCAFLQLYAKCCPGLMASSSDGDVGEVDVVGDTEVKAEPDKLPDPSITCDGDVTSVVAVNLSAGDSTSSEGVTTSVVPSAATAAPMGHDSDSVTSVCDGDATSVVAENLSAGDGRSSEGVTTSVVPSAATTAAAGADGDSMTSMVNGTVATNSRCCRLKELSDSSGSCDQQKPGGAVLWRTGWRQQLCKCDECHSLYNQLGVVFLIDESDTIAAYEERGKRKSASTPTPYQQGLAAFSSSLNRIQQVEMLQGYSELKTELTSYLQKFAENKKVVREEDIMEFFEQLESRKRQRVSESGGPQYYCK